MEQFSKKFIAVAAFAVIVVGALIIDTTVYAVHAQTADDISPICDKPDDALCWRRVEPYAECYVWEAKVTGPEVEWDIAGERHLWSGGCENKKARGRGLLVQHVIDNNVYYVFIGEGLIAGGKMQGQWVIRDSEGNTLRGMMADGAPHGEWQYDYPAHRPDETKLWRHGELRE